MVTAAMARVPCALVAARQVAVAAVATIAAAVAAAAVMGQPKVKRKVVLTMGAAGGVRRR